MALKIRLRQQGGKNRQTYRVVVMDARNRRDGKYIEKLGWYLPYLPENNCRIDGERMEHWLLLGAQMSDQVKALAEVAASESLLRFKAAKEVIAQARIERKREKRQAKRA